MLGCIEADCCGESFMLRHFQDLHDWCTFTARRTTKSKNSVKYYVIIFVIKNQQQLVTDLPNVAKCRSSWNLKLQLDDFVDLKNSV